MKRAIHVAMAAAVVLAGCRASDELTISPSRKPGEGTVGKYPDGGIPPAGLTNPGDQRAYDPNNAARGLDLRADWAATGRTPGAPQPPPFGAHGAVHNGPSDVDHRPPQPSMMDAPTRGDAPKHEPVPSPSGGNPSGAPPHAGH